jgi:uncharacterized protein YkwD
MAVSEGMTAPRKAKRSRILSVVTLVAAAVLLPGCGVSRASHGGGHGETAAEMNAAAREAFELVNAQRFTRSLKPLKISDRCVAAAQSHAEDQAGRKTLSHGSPTESFAARMKRWGLLQWPVAENIGRGPTATAVVDSWMKSPRHRANMLDPAYASGGAGFSGDTYTLCLSGDSGD